MLRIFFIALIVGPFCAGAHAASESFDATVQGTAYKSDVPVYYADDAPYLPLVEMAQELGGSARIISPTEAEVMVNGRMATISLNNVRYSVGGESRNLTKPFISYEREVLAPRDETIEFFRNAFGIELTQAQAGTPAPAEGEQGLLESVPLAPPGQESAAPAPVDGEMATEEPPLLESDAIAAKPEDTKPTTFSTLVIDAGHGGEDTGAQGPGGAAEKDICLGIAQRLAQELQGSAFTVVMTRNDDTGPSLAERASMVKQQEKPFVVSIHTGASLAPGAEGVEVFYASDYSRSRVAGSKARTAAEVIASRLESESGATLRGVRRAPLRLFQAADAPGCLVETGCITNANEEALLATANYQEKIARGLAEGIRQLAAGS